MINQHPTTPEGAGWNIEFRGKCLQLSVPNESTSNTLVLYREALSLTIFIIITVRKWNCELLPLCPGDI